jgi:predicted ester cyclase
MSGIDVVKAGIAAWCAADWDAFATLLTDDFAVSTASGGTISRQDFTDYGRALLIAFPDLAFNARDFREEGDTVYATIEETGTHTGTLAAVPGVAPVAATGKHVKNPPEHHVYTIRGAQCSHLALVVPPDGGIAGIYAQVGAPIR